LGLRRALYNKGKSKGVTRSSHYRILLAQVYMNLLSYQDSETEIRLQLEAIESRKGHGEGDRIAALSTAYQGTMSRIKQQHLTHATLAK
jgi:hypothetical protein